MLLQNDPNVDARIDAGESDDTIIAALEADASKRRNVPIGVARQLLVTEWGLIRRIGGVESGPLADLYQSLSDGPQREAVGALIAHLLDNASAAHVVLTDHENAAAFDAVMPLLNLSDDQVAQLEAFHGGRKYADLAKIDVTRYRIHREARRRYAAAMDAALAEIDSLTEAGSTELATALDDARTAMIGGWDGA